MPSQQLTLPARLEGKRVCVCAGAGGVGKTTMSAALALGLAAGGQKVAVLSIDPAKRLAGALGMGELSWEPQLIDPDLFNTRGVQMRGELWAMMLDSKRTFDQMIERLAPDENTRDEVLSNRIYQEISGAVAGSQEFTAVTKLYELHSDGEFDVIVLDTPPSRNAIDFLEAPGRLTRFMDGRALAMFLAPGGVAARFLGRGSGILFSLFARVSGVDLLNDLSVFFRSLSSLIDGLRERSTGTEELLRDRSSTFLIISTPEHEPAREAIFLHSKLSQMGLPFGALIVNRVHDGGLEGHTAEELNDMLVGQLGDRLAGRVAGNLADYGMLAQRDRQSIANLREQLAEPEPILLSELERDIADIDGLVSLARELFGWS